MRMKSIRLHLFHRLIDKTPKKRFERLSRGQSLVELSLVVVFLGLILAGVVEMGFLLNQYLHVLDGSREAARYSSNNVPFNLDPEGAPTGDRPEFYYLTAAKVAEVMAPVILNPVNPDDIIVSVFSVAGGEIKRFPEADPSGWSLCTHYADFAAYFTHNYGAIPINLSNSAWSSCHPRQTQMSTTFIMNHMDTGAPNSGVLLVEVYYSYPQLLKLPVMTSVLPDPIPIYVYSIMPNSGSEPTQVP